MATHAQADGPNETPDEEIYDPLAAAAREAQGKTTKGFPFKVGGEVFYLKNQGRLSRQATKRIELMQADDEVTGTEFLDELFKLLLGPEQFKRFDKAADEVELSPADMGNILDEGNKFYGISVPESSTSTASSKSRSKRKR